MEIILLLCNKVAQLLIIMMVGFTLVKIGIFKNTDSKVLSKLVIYVINVCVHINAFQIALSDEIVKSFGIEVVIAIGIIGAGFAMGYLVDKIFHLQRVELAATIYTNQGSLLIPIVSSILGADKVIYLCSFMIVQLPLMFTHGRIILGRKEKLTLKHIFGNIGVVDIIIGFILFITNIRLPSVVSSTMDSISAMTGPMAMLIAGITLGGIDIKKSFMDIRLYMICFLKLIVMPIVILLVMKLIRLDVILANHGDLLYVAMLCAAGPTASSILAISQLYGGDSEYASRINAVSTFLCVFTIPLMALIYQYLIGIY